MTLDPYELPGDPYEVPEVYPDWHDVCEEYFCPHGNSVPVEGGACYWCVQEEMGDGND